MLCGARPDKSNRARLIKNGGTATFNLLISADDTAWEARGRMRMLGERFLECSGDECEGIALSNLGSLKKLEGIPSVLMYEPVVAGSAGDRVRVGEITDIQAGKEYISFEFAEYGHLDRRTVLGERRLLQLGQYEESRTHWAVKDGELPGKLLHDLIPATLKYDVALSYAEEDSEYVERVASRLKSSNVSVYFYPYEDSESWGKPLGQHLNSIFQKARCYCVIFVSEHYARKPWPSHEFTAALAGALERPTEYILPVRFDGTMLPGLPPDIGYMDARSKNPEQVADLIIHKLKRWISSTGSTSSAGIAPP